MGGKRRKREKGQRMLLGDITGRETYPVEGKGKENKEEKWDKGGRREKGRNKKR